MHKEILPKYCPFCSCTMIECTGSRFFTNFKTYICKDCEKEFGAFEQYEEEA